MPYARRSLVHTTSGGVRVYVERGTKSKWDFKVLYPHATRGLIGATHAEIVLDVYQKRLAEPEATEQLIAHFLGIIARVQPVSHFPPKLVQFNPNHVTRFHELGLRGAIGLDVELLLIMFELIQIQEKTNYRDGRAPRELFLAIRDNPHDVDDIAYRAVIVAESNEYPETLVARDALAEDLRQLFGQ